MFVHVEPIVAVVRVFENERVFGEPYEWSCTARWLDCETVELMGVVSISQPVRRALDGLADYGVKKVIAKRPGKRPLIYEVRKNAKEARKETAKDWKESGYDESGFYTRAVSVD